MKFQRGFVEVDLGKLKANVSALKQSIKKDTKLIAVVKADAYGHGYVECAKAAVEAGADWLAVAIPDEGEELRRAGIENRILVLGGITFDQVADSVDNDFDQCVYSVSILNALSEYAKRVGKTAKVHIKADTGMGRIGVKTIEELDRLIDHIDEGIDFAGFFSHFSSSDEDEQYTRMQLKRFLELAEHVKKRGFSPMLHISNSAAVLNYPEANLDAVRPGIAIYGLYPSDTVKRDVVLKPVMSVYTQVVYVKYIEPGQTVSYNNTFAASKRMKVATISLGYGDGFKRALSNKGEVLIHGERAPIIGRVCMDQAMVDVTHIKSVTPGDIAVVLGSQGTQTISADDIAKTCDTINYEIVLSFLPRVKRIYVE